MSQKVTRQLIKDIEEHGVNERTKIKYDNQRIQGWTPTFVHDRYYRKHNKPIAYHLPPIPISVSLDQTSVTKHPTIYDGLHGAYYLNDLYATKQESDESGNIFEYEEHEHGQRQRAPYKIYTPYDEWKEYDRTRRAGESRRWDWKRAWYENATCRRKAPRKKESKSKVTTQEGQEQGAPADGQGQGGQGQAGTQEQTLQEGDQKKKETDGKPAWPPDLIYPLESDSSEFGICVCKIDSPPPEPGESLEDDTASVSGDFVIKDGFLERKDDADKSPEIESLRSNGRRRYSNGSQDNIERRYSNGSQDSIERRYSIGSNDSIERRYSNGSQDSIERRYSNGSRVSASSRYSIDRRRSSYRSFDTRGSFEDYQSCRRSFSSQPIESPCKGRRPLERTVSCKSFRGSLNKCVSRGGSSSRDLNVCKRGSSQRVQSSVCQPKSTVFKSNIPVLQPKSEIEISKHKSLYQGYTKGDVGHKYCIQNKTTSRTYSSIENCTKKKKKHKRKCSNKRVRKMSKSSIFRNDSAPSKQNYCKNDSKALKKVTKSCGYDGCTCALIAKLMMQNQSSQNDLSESSRDSQYFCNISSG